MSRHTELGTKGEILALEFLESKGYTILEINWHFEKTEVDIIAKNRNELVIVEVKTRTSDYFGLPEESVTREKQKHLAEAADEYLEQNNLDMDVRFDIVSITFGEGLPKIFHIKDAFFPMND